jgi:tRNA pseudouridine55 synthase
VPSGRQRGREVHGILVLDKPRGLTSNRALQTVKRLFQARKAGHTGSLDPLATGALPICFGAATKFTSFLLDARKAYHVVGELGAATDTGDAEGVVVARAEPPTLEEPALRARLAEFEGDIEQVPPMHSAVKHRGERLYKLARKGVLVERKPRTVTIHALELVSYRRPRLELAVTCSKGTYILALVSDIAEALGTVGHVRELRRLTVGPFGADRMHTLEALETAARDDPRDLDELLLPMDSAVLDWPGVHLSEASARRLGHGQAVLAEPQWSGGPVRLYGPGERFLGIGEVLPGGVLVPRRIVPV